MEITLIILSSILSGAFFVFFAALGFFIGVKYKSSKDDEALHINEQNAEAYKQLLEWFNFNGGRNEN